MTVSASPGSVSKPALNPDAIVTWAGDHRLPLILIGLGVGLVVLLVLGQATGGVKVMFNVVVGLGVIVAAAVLYGYSDQLMKLFGAG